MITHKYYALFPEVCGEITGNTIFRKNDASCATIESLACMIDLWSGDCLIKVSEYLISNIVVNDSLFPLLSGFLIKDVEIRTRLMQHNHDSFPEWKWIKITGVPMKDDFGIDVERRLIVSQEAFNLLQKHGFSHADVYYSEEAPTLEERSQNLLEEMRRIGTKTVG